MGPWATWSSGTCPCPWQGCWNLMSWRSFPTQAMLWVYDSTVLEDGDTELQLQSSKHLCAWAALLLALQNSSQKERWWLLCAHQMKGSGWHQYRARSDHSVKRDTDSHRAVYVTYRHWRFAVGFWKENTTAMPLAAIRCFSDDTWWTKAKAMKRSLKADYCAELHHPSRYLHCCT